MNLDGIIAVANIPFTEGYRIDIDSLIKSIRYALDSGVSGILVPAMASEIDKLTRGERDTIIGTVLNTVGGKIPVIGGASAPTREDRLYYVEKLIDMGCNGILVNIPYRNDESFKESIYEIDRLHPPLLMIQDWDFGGYGIPLNVITELFEKVESFKSLKIEVVPSGVKYTEVIRATAGKLHVAGGWAVMQMIEALDRGVNSLMLTGMYEIYVTIFNRYRKGDREGAKNLFNRVLPVLAFSNQHLDISIHFFKRLLYKQRIFSTPLVRKPCLPFDEYHVRIADEMIELVEEIASSLA